MSADPLMDEAKTMHVDSDTVSQAELNSAKDFGMKLKNVPNSVSKEPEWERGPKRKRLRAYVQRHGGYAFLLRVAFDGRDQSIQINVLGLTVRVYVQQYYIHKLVNRA